MINLQKKSLVFAIALVTSLGFITACAHRNVLSLGSHTVTISRHGVQKKYVVDQNAAVPTLDYEGVSPDGRNLKVAIKGDAVSINDRVSGNLRKGDKVLITDDGVAINSLDYGESEKYLRANSASSNVSGLN